MNYVIDENNNKIEALSKEEVFAVLEQAIEEGTLEHIMEDSAFVSKLKCCVSGITNKVAFVSQAKYNELKDGGLLETNALYFITDDTTAENIDIQLEDLITRTTDLESKVAVSEDKIKDIETGFTIVPRANISNSAESSDKAKLLNPTWSKVLSTTTFGLGTYVIRVLYERTDTTAIPPRMFTFTIFIGTDESVIYTSNVCYDNSSSNYYWINCQSGTIAFSGTLTDHKATMYYCQIM